MRIKFVTKRRFPTGAYFWCYPYNAKKHLLCRLTAVRVNRFEVWVGADEMRLIADLSLDLNLALDRRTGEHPVVVGHQVGEGTWRPP